MDEPEITQAQLRAVVKEKRLLETEVVKIAENAQMQIGHDLHDGVGQILTGIISLTEALETRLEGQERQDASRIRVLLGEAMQQVRDLSHGLSPAPLGKSSLGSGLRRLAIQISRKGLECKVRIDNEPKIDSMESKSHLFRIAQEAVNNALKHANPRQIHLSLRRLAGGFYLMLIQDDGVGISLNKTRSGEGIGARVMKYRAQLIGGELKLRRRSEGGTEVRCRFPCAD